jgi:hypothetical protein
VKGALVGSANTDGEHYGVVAHSAIGAVTVAGKKLTPPWPNPDNPTINIRVLQNI